MNDKHENLHHDSANKHVSGKSVYVNDITAGDRQLYGHVFYSPHAHARIRRYSLDKARALAGVAAVISAEDIPGANQMGPVIHDEPCLASGEVHCIGQAIFLIAAESREIALKAAALIEIEFEALPAVLSIEEAEAAGTLLAPPRYIERGDADAAMNAAPHRLSGELKTGGQEHWYLETQTALCVPGEGKEYIVYASSQNPAETQAIVAEVLGVPKNEIETEVRRMGGAFGGKETQGNHVAAWAALLAFHTRRPVLIHLFRDDDQLITGKRHRFLSRYEIGFDDSGRILAYKVELNADGGCATDLTMAILERALLHADNAYFLPDVKITGKAWRTNLPSNTAFRGFGGPQGMVVIENAIDRIARFLGKDPFEVRKENFYKQETNNTTPYGQLVENNRLYTIAGQILSSSDYLSRRDAALEFNRNHKFVKRSVYLTPVKFGISFTTSFLNQAGALVNVYTDGTVLVNHGGTEMGQGLNTKMLQVAAAEFGINPARIKVNATNTSKVPNTSATAASSGSDLNGMAVKNAVAAIRSRLEAYAASLFSENHTDNPSAPTDIIFENDRIFDSKNKDREIGFSELIAKAYVAQVNLSANGFYRTPDIYFDRAAGKGKPFHYFTFGMSVSEVEVDLLTGRHRILRADILHDAGKSLNEALDKGQVEGAFIQGVGWCTSEELKWNADGRLLNHSPDTYKIPSIQDIPEIFNVALLQNAPNPSTIRQSKAVGEPPFMHAFSVWLAIKETVAWSAENKIEPDYSLPATNEQIVLAAEKIKRK